MFDIGLPQYPTFSQSPFSFVLIYYSSSCMARHSDHLCRRKSSAAVAALVTFSMARLARSTFQSESPMHIISPLPALDCTMVNISKNSRGQIGSIPCTESHLPTSCLDEILLPPTNPTKPNVSPTVASLLSRPDSRLTPLSNFPSRGLPPLGVSPQCLDTAEDEYFEVSMLLFTPEIRLIPHNP